MEFARSELITGYPEIKKTLEFMDDQTGLASLLQHVGENIEAFFKYFPNTTSLEEVRQELVRRDGEVVRSARTRYDYLMLGLPVGKIGLQESRLDLKGNPVEISGLERGLLLTRGYASSAILFHPLYQSGCRFRYVGHTSTPRYHVIAFAQRPEDPKTLGHFSIPGRRVPILAQGLAWVEPNDHQIVRMHTNLLAPTDMGLESLATEIEYGAVSLGRPLRAFWLPREVTVKLTFEHAVYRNRHRYSRYKLFSVESMEKRTLPDP